MSPAPAAPQLGTDDGDDLDALFAQQCIRVRVAVVGEDHTRRRADEVGAAVPLRAFAYVSGTAGLDDAHLFHSERIGHGFYKWLLVFAQLDPAGFIAGP